VWGWADTLRHGSGAFRGSGVFLPLLGQVHGQDWHACAQRIPGQDSLHARAVPVLPASHLLCALWLLTVNAAGPRLGMYDSHTHERGREGESARARASERASERESESERGRERGGERREREERKRDLVRGGGNGGVGGGGGGWVGGGCVCV
jgi:hypothetical protein